MSGRIAEGRKAGINDLFHGAAADHMAVHSLFPGQIDHILPTRKTIQIVPAAAVKSAVPVILFHKSIQHLIADIFLRFHVIDQKTLKLVTVYDHTAALKSDHLRTVFQCQETLTTAVLLHLIEHIAVSAKEDASVVRDPDMHRILLLRCRKFHRKLRAVRFHDEH